MGLWMATRRRLPGVVPPASVLSAWGRVIGGEPGLAYLSPGIDPLFRGQGPWEGAGAGAGRSGGPGGTGTCLQHRLS